MRRVYIGRIGHHVRERDIERFMSREGKIREVLMKDGFAFVEFDHASDAESAVRHLNGKDLSGEKVHVEFAKGPPRRSNDVGGGDRGRDRFGSMGGGSRGPMSRSGPISRNFRNDRGRDRGDNFGRRDGGGISYAEKYGPPRNTDFRVIVENLSSRVSWQDLKDLMRKAGEVTFADAHKRERNMGIVDFASIKDMKQAIETLDDTEFHGRRIKVYEDKGRRYRGSGNGASGGASFGRRAGRSRSRSRSRGRYSSSRSRSRERAPVSRSRSRSRTRSRSISRTRSRSPVVKRARETESRSRSPIDKERETKSRSRSPVHSERESKSRSRSPVNSVRDSKSRSKSPVDKQRETKSRSRSASNSPARNVLEDNMLYTKINDA